MYSSVPTHEELQGRYDDSEALANSPPPHFADDNSYPERLQASRSMSAFGLDDDPYARYGDHDMSRGGSMANLSEMDGQSQLGLHARGRSGSNLGYADGYGTKEDGASQTSSGRRNLRRGGAAAGGGGFWSKLSSKGKKLLIIGAIVALIIIIIAVAVPAAIVSSNNNNNKNNAAADSGSSSSRSIVNSAPSGVPTGGSDTDWKTAATGGDGSTVYMQDGTSFIYNNTFGECLWTLRAR